MVIYIKKICVIIHDTVVPTIQQASKHQCNLSKSYLCRVLLEATKRIYRFSIKGSRDVKRSRPIPDWVGKRLTKLQITEISPSARKISSHSPQSHLLASELGSWLHRVHELQLTAFRCCYAYREYCKLHLLATYERKNSKFPTMETSVSPTRKQ